MLDQEKPFSQKMIDWIDFIWSKAKNKEYGTQRAQI